MRLQIAGGLAVPWKENVKLHLMIGSGGVALEDLEGIRRKKKKREDTVSRFSRSRGTTRLGCVLVHTEEGLVRDNGYATMTSQTNNSLFFVHAE